MDPISTDPESLPEQQPQGSSRRRTGYHWHNKSLEELRKLYFTECLPLKDVMRIMGEHECLASEKQFKKQIDRLSLGKKVKGDEYDAIVQIQSREEALGKKTIFYVRGREVSEAKINRWRKRNPRYRSRHANSTQGRYSAPPSVRYRILESEGDADTNVELPPTRSSSSSQDLPSPLTPPNQEQTMTAALVCQRPDFHPPPAAAIALAGTCNSSQAYVYLQLENPLPLPDCWRAWTWLMQTVNHFAIGSSGFRGGYCVCTESNAGQCHHTSTRASTWSFDDDSIDVIYSGFALARGRDSETRELGEKLVLAGLVPLQHYIFQCDYHFELLQFMLFSHQLFMPLPHLQAQIFAFFKALAREALGQGHPLAIVSTLLAEATKTGLSPSSTIDGMQVFAWQMSMYYPRSPLMGIELCITYMNLAMSHDPHGRSFRLDKLRRLEIILKESRDENLISPEDYSRCMTYLAWSFLNHQELGRAEELTKEVLRFESQASFRPLHLLGMLSIRNGKVDDGITRIQKAVGLGGSAVQIQALRTLEGAYRKSGKFDMAMQTQQGWKQAARRVLQEMDMKVWTDRLGPSE